ncbi:MAG: putative bifunctional diguanylate cyclase/phosphodiesterase [Rhizobiaceae bacterium]
MTPTILSVLIEFAIAHPWIVAGRIAIALVLVYGVVSYRRLYKESRQAALDSAALIENLTEGVYRSSPDGRQLSANRALVRLNGYETEAEQLAAVRDIAKEWYVDPDRREDFKARMEQDGYVEDFVSEIYRHKTRERIWISESARVVKDAKTGKIKHYEGSVREITDSIRRLEIEERFRKLTDMVPGGLFQLVRNPNGTFTAPYVSSGFCRTVGIAETESVSDPTSYFHTVHPDDRQRYLLSLRESGLNLTVWNVEYRVIDTDGVERWLDVVAQPERTGRTVTWYGYIYDITERKRQELEIEEMAYVDPLTGLPNRRVLMDRLSQTMTDCKRRNLFGAAIFIDLDHFKDLNDTHGHEVGDMFLVQVAERLQQTVRGGDTVARIGGDEFVVLLQSVGQEDWIARDNTMAVADKIMSAMREPYQLKKLGYKSTASLGAVIYDGTQDSPDAILTQADQAMYEAKSGGRDSIGTAFAIKTGETEANGEEELLASDLARALRRRELELKYQPQVDRNGNLVGAEGFIRWPHPEHGTIRADRLLPLAKKAGLSTDLDILAMNIAVETLALWSRTPGLETVRLAVNAGTSFLLDEGAIEQISSLIDEHRVRPGMLTIEITEQVHRSARENIETRMTALKEAGIRFSLDDFGSGYSSITYLKQLAFDEVKIEGAFVSGIDGDEDNEALVKTILAMAGTLGITAVAEHVESERQEAFLRAYGCDVFQGRYYGGAMSFDEFTTFADENRQRPTPDRPPDETDLSTGKAG